MPVRQQTSVRIPHRYPVTVDYGRTPQRTVRVHRVASRRRAGRRRPEPSWLRSCVSPTRPAPRVEVSACCLTVTLSTVEHVEQLRTALEAAPLPTEIVRYPHAAHPSCPRSRRTKGRALRCTRRLAANPDLPRRTPALFIRATSGATADSKRSNVKWTVPGCVDTTAPRLTVDRASYAG